MLHSVMELTPLASTHLRAGPQCLGHGTLISASAIFFGMPNSSTPPSSPPKKTSVFTGKPPWHSPFLGMVPYEIHFFPDLYAAPALILIFRTDASPPPE